MLAIDDALTQLSAHITPITEVETIPLIQATGRVLPTTIESTIDVPPADNSAMDGYAVHTADLLHSNTLLISQTINAGHAPKPLSKGTAARIFTGAEIPMGANTVVMQEQCVRQDDKVTFTSKVNENNNIRLRGQDINQGDSIFNQGKLLQPQDIGLLASIGISDISVYRKLRVAIISTGDELTEPGKPLLAGKIYSSNRYLLHSFLQKMGIDTVDIGDIPDTLPDTIAALKRAAQADCIISTGGVSVGDEDHIKQAVLELGKLDFWKIAIKPGKPVAFGQININGESTPFIGLPGNPASVFVTFLLFARTFLLAQSHQPANIPVGQQHTANFPWAANSIRQEYLRARKNSHGSIDIHPKQNSGILSSTSWAEGFVVVPPQHDITLGDKVEFIAFNDFF